MRVAHFRLDWLPPTETFLHDLREALPCEQIVLCRRQQNPHLFPTPSLIASEGSLPAFIRHAARKLEVLGLPLPREICFWTDVLRREKPDLVHAHFGRDGIFILPAAQRAGIPLVVTFHGYDATRFPRQFLGYGHWMTRRFLGRVPQVIAISENMKGKLMALGCPAERIAVVPVGIRLEDLPYHPPTPPGSGEPLRIACVARFIEKKGLLYLLQAFHRVRQRYPGTRLLLIGDGPLRSMVEGMIADLRYEECVELPGMLPLAKVLARLRTAHLYAQPSVAARNGDEEGLPVTLMQAMALGLPVAATRHSGIPELVEDGVTGLLVPERDGEGLAEALFRLIEQPEDWPRLTLAGRKRVEERHSLEAEARGVMEVYRTLN